MELPRLSPDGFVAQWFPENFNNHGHWVVTSWAEDTGLTLAVKSDTDVEEWPELIRADG
jgi:hypothetical protein